jgi:hypothetical protein
MSLKIYLVKYRWHNSETRRRSGVVNMKVKAKDETDVFRALYAKFYQTHNKNCFVTDIRSISVLKG